MRRSALRARSPAKPLADRHDLRAIAFDRARGATELAELALIQVARLARDRPVAPLSQQRRELRRFAAELRRAQPAMGPFLRWSTDLRRIAARGRAPTTDLRRWLRRTRVGLRSEQAGLVRQARRYLAGPGPVLTLSHSRSVVRALLALPRRERPARVWVLRSFPGGEGAETVRELRRGGQRADLFPDRRGVELAARSRLVVIGADAVRPDGGVVHKVGTRSIAGAAHRAGVPVWVVAGRSKVVARRTRMPRLPALFDVTPARWITGVVTERGPLHRAP